VAKNCKKIAMGADASMITAENPARRKPSLRLTGETLSGVLHSPPDRQKTIGKFTQSALMFRASALS